MVAPSWESFKGPDQDQQLQQPEQHIIDEYEEEVPGEIEDAKAPEGEKPDWGNFQSPTTYQGEIDPQEEESTFGYVTRNIAANASRVVEQALGVAGNFERMGSDLLSNYPKMFGILPWAMSEFLGKEEWEKRLSSQILPTSSDFQKLSEEITGGFTKPKNKGEKRFQDYTSDIAATFLTRRLPSLRGLAVNNIGIPIAANAVKDALDQNGVGESKQDVAKLGTWLVLSLAANINAPKYASGLMNRGRNGIPEQVNIDVPRFQQNLQNVANSHQLLHADPRTALARQEISAIQRDLANGQVSTRSLMTTYDGVNAAKRDAGLFGMGATDKRFATAAIDRVRDVVREEILTSGAAHPEALRNWQSGVQAWSTIHRSQFIRNWVESSVKSKYAKLFTGPATGLFGLGAVVGAQNPIATGVAGGIASGVGTGIYKTGQTLYRVFNDPTLAGYYGRAISAASEKNLPVFLSNYQKLNKGLEKSEPSKVNSKGKK